MAIKNFPIKDWSYHSYRNCKLENYVDAVNLATQKGYYVFRMGATPGKTLEINNDRFIDYAKLYRTDFLDVYLANKCKFSISTGTGWDALSSWTFRKPHVWTNAVPIGIPVLNPCEKLIFSIKLHYNIKKNKYLSLNEILNSKLMYASSIDSFNEENIELHENDSEDIKNMVIEMINYIEKIDDKSEEDLIFQSKIQSIYKNNLRLPNSKYKIFNTTMSKNFIKKYNFLINEI